MNSFKQTKRLFPLCLAALLQVMPMVRMIVPMQARGVAPSSWAIVLKLAAGAAALLGSYHAVSGATAIVTPYTVNAEVGKPYNRQLTTSVRTAKSWSANTAPLRTAVFPLTPGLWLTNSNGRIGGIPTQAITSSIPITAWENSGNSGASITATFLFTITNAIILPPAPPSITVQPQSLTRNVGTIAIFSVSASGTAPLAYQWRFNGTNIANATGSNYAKLVQLGDAGNYSVMITNTVGSTISSNATLSVLTPTADVVVLSRGPPTALPNGTVVYTINVTNLGPSAASAVVISDRIPATAAFVSASGSGILNNNGVVTWPTLASLGARAATNFTVTVSAPSDGLLTNSVFGSSSTVDPNPGNNDGSSSNAISLTTVIPQADVIVVKTGPASVLSGSNITYTISVTNLGPSTASNVMVADQLPDIVSFVRASDGGINSSGLVTWPVIPSLAAGQASNFTVLVTAPGNGSFTNIASATSNTADPDTTNNDGSSPASQVFSIVVNPQADVITSVSGPSNVVASGSVTYLVSATNLGPSPADNLQVYDTLPANATFVSASDGGILNNGIVTWPVITKLSSGSTVSFTVTVTAPIGGALLNSVSSTSSSPDPIGSNNDGTSPSANVTTIVGPRADVAVLSSGPPTTLPGGTVVYMLVVTNAGPSSASNVVVRDSLPLGSTFIAATGGGVPAGGVVTWPEIPALDSGAAVSFAVTMTAPGGGVMTNTVFANASIADPNPANNDGTSPASQAITTIAIPQFAISTGTPTLNPQTGLFEQTVTINNFGTVAAPAVRLYVDGLRPGVELYNATGTNAGRLYVQSNAALNPNQTLVFLLKFYVSDRRPFTNTFEAEWVVPSPASAVSGNGFAITRGLIDQRSGLAPRFLIEFATVPGGFYTVIYSEDMLTWKAAVPSFTASGTTTQWYDDGPPTTDSNPLSGTHRFYRVVIGAASP